MSQERAGASSYQKAVQSLGLGEALGLTSPGLCAVSLLKPGIGDPAAGQFHLRWKPASWLVDGAFSLGQHTLKRLPLRPSPPRSAMSRLTVLGTCGHLMRPLPQTPYFYLLQGKQLAGPHPRAAVRTTPPLSTPTLSPVLQSQGDLWNKP